MHWITFVLGSALLVTARTKTAEASEQFDLTQQESPREIYEEKGRSVWSPIPEKEIYAVLNRMNEKGESGEMTSGKSTEFLTPLFIDIIKFIK